MSSIGDIDESASQPSLPSSDARREEPQDTGQDDSGYDPRQPSGESVVLSDFSIYSITRVQHAVASTGSYCYENVCDKDPTTGENSGGCAKCFDFRVYLPLNAQIKSVAYLSTAGYPDDVPLREVGAGEQAWAYMTPYVLDTTPNNRVVSSRFFNRSHNRDRIGGLEVIWE